VNVSDENEVGFGFPGEINGFGGIQIDEFPSSLNECAGVVQGCDADWPRRSQEDLGLVVGMRKRSQK
jgi:hypothetical protein